MQIGVYFLRRNKHTIVYGVSLALLLCLLKWLELRLVILHHALELYVAAIALIFTALGIWLALKLTKPKIKTVIVEKEVFIREFKINDRALNELQLSKRELEVLKLMAEGLSNSEISQQLFVSLSTIKTHTNNLFEKMGVERRTQAIDKARKLGIIP